MTKEEIVAKRDEAVKMIQQGVNMIEQLKGQVAVSRGKVVVYDELLAENADTEIPPLKAVESEAKKGKEKEAQA